MDVKRTKLALDEALEARTMSDLSDALETLLEAIPEANHRLFRCNKCHYFYDINELAIKDDLGYLCKSCHDMMENLFSWTEDFREMGK